MSPPPQLREGSAAECSGPEKEGRKMEGEEQRSSSLGPHLSAAIILVSLCLGRNSLKRALWPQVQCSCLENPHEQKSLAGYSPWGHKESDMTERLSIAYSTALRSAFRPFSVTPAVCSQCISLEPPAHPTAPTPCLSQTHGAESAGHTPSQPHSHVHIITCTLSHTHDLKHTCRHTHIF